MQKNMMRVLSFIAILLLGNIKSTAQVNDVSFIVSPTAEYMWWDKNLSIDNMPLYGGKIGFGFGPLFELRTFYLGNTNGNAKVRPLNWLTNTEWSKNIQDTKLDLTKYGGELKLNLWKGNIFAPYLTVGGGVQQMKYNTFKDNIKTTIESLKDEQLFATVGVGAKLNLSKRTVLSLEAKNTMFNSNDGSYLMKPEYNSAHGGKHLYNWTAAATLDFYLGGRAKESADAISKEYHKLFASGFKGIKFVIEPTVAYLDFNKDLPMTDTYLLGASAGFDLSSLVGLRGFYYQANKEANKLSLDFNDQLSLYGGNLITRLNFPRGITPYLQLGGGYMKVGEKYADSQGNTTAESSPFVFGGAGIEIPLSRYIALFGTANALFTSKKGIKEEDIQNTDHIKTSVMYNAGVRFNIGKAANGEKKYKNFLNQQLDEQRSISNEKINELRATYDEQIEDYNDKVAQYDEQIADYEARINSLKSDYINKINRLDAELEKALKANDTIKVAEIARLKDRNKQELENIEVEEMATKRKLVNSLGQDNGNNIKLTRSELNELVRRIIREARESVRCYDDEYYYVESQNSYKAVVPMQKITPAKNNETEQLRRELRIMNEKLNKIISQRNTGEATVIYDGNGAGGNLSNSIIQNEETRQQVTTAPRFKLNRIGILTGLGFGDMTAFNVGVRGYMQIAATNLDFVPELYASMANKSGMGVSGNVIYNLKINALGKFTPYFGLGLGVFHGKDTHFGSNIIIGVSTNILQGKLFVDYSARSLMKQNQIAVGYSFTF